LKTKFKIKSNPGSNFQVPRGVVAEQQKHRNNLNVLPVGFLNLFTPAEFKAMNRAELNRAYIKYMEQNPSETTDKIEIDDVNPDADGVVLGFPGNAIERGATAVYGSDAL
jgi:hypothetical protein